MNEFTIKDLENLSGIKAHTIRIWEQRYSFLKPQRSKTNIRYYQSDELKKILNVALLNKYGFKISHIDKMSEDTMREKIFSLTQADAQQQRVINSLLHSLVDLDTEVFENTLDQYIREQGIDKTISNLVFPFLHRIGILWATDHIRVAQEHFITHLIRQKLVMGIENASPLQKTNKTVVLFLPSGEHHDLGIMYVYYQLKIRGVKVIYLGADLPIEELAFVCNIKNPDYVYTHLTSLPPKLSFKSFLDQIHTQAGNNTVVISGSITQTHHSKIPQRILFCKTMQEVLEQLTH